jgi:hypothetical protein
MTLQVVVSHMIVILMTVEVSFMLLENIHSTGINHGDSGKIGFLPNGLWHVMLKVGGTNLW